VAVLLDGETEVASQDVGLVLETNQASVAKDRQNLVHETA
jgi:hypothetical protein